MPVFCIVDTGSCFLMWSHFLWASSWDLRVLPHHAEQSMRVWKNSTWFLSQQYGIFPNNWSECQLISGRRGKFLFNIWFSRAQWWHQLSPLSQCTCEINSKSHGPPTWFLENPFSTNGFSITCWTRSKIFVLSKYHHTRIHTRESWYVELLCSKSVYSAVQKWGMFLVRK